MDSPRKLQQMESVTYRSDSKTQMICPLQRKTKMLPSMCCFQQCCFIQSLSSSHPTHGHKRQARRRFDNLWQTPHCGLAGSKSVIFQGSSLTRGYFYASYTSANQILLIFLSEKRVSTWCKKVFTFQFYLRLFGFAYFYFLKGSRCRIYIRMSQHCLNYDWVSREAILFAISSKIGRDCSLSALIISYTVEQTGRKSFQNEPTSYTARMIVYLTKDSISTDKALNAWVSPKNLFNMYSLFSYLRRRMGQMIEANSSPNFLLISTGVPSWKQGTKMLTCLLQRKQRLSSATWLRYFQQQS